jgi:hypothetical protein
MSNLRDHAVLELQMQGFYKDLKEGDPSDEMTKMARENVLELLDVFDKQGHSGMSAPWIVGMFTKLAKFEPLGPLTGVDAEWTEVAQEDGEPLWQNKRCSHVFKTPYVAYDINGRVFRDPDGSTYPNRDSRVEIKFPYTPKVEYVDRLPA